MEESLLEKREGTVDNDHEATTWVEYWHEGELVHRSAHVTLKQPATFAGGETASFS
jgi:cation transport regulator ChaC